MGTPKAWLDWHGSTLLRRVCGIVARGAGGPVVVVRAPGQELPELPGGVRVVEDAREGQGPLQGLLAGLAGPRLLERIAPPPEPVAEPEPPRFVRDTEAQPAQRTTA